MKGTNTFPRGGPYPPTRWYRQPSRRWVWPTPEGRCGHPSLVYILKYILIVEKHGDVLFTSELQFAFKPRHSTNMCTAVLKEVCSYFKCNNTDVYLCTLDASKAFDRVHYGKLFSLLRDRKVPVSHRKLTPVVN